MYIEASRVESFESRFGVRFAARLGAGANGEVHSTDRSSAVKFFYPEQEESYHRERRAYILLRDRNIRDVCGHRLPLLHLYDDDLMAIEMSTVSPPYLLDFASA